MIAKPLLDIPIDQIAINRIRAHCPREGLDVAVSFGKDSIVLLHLVDRAGVPYRAYYSRAMEPPEVTQFGKREYPQVVWLKPKQTMYELCMQELLLPSRVARFCCKTLKENVPGYQMPVLATGVRHSESVRRRKRQMYEQCQARGSGILNPIIDWSTVDVWDYIYKHGLAYPSLYDEGRRRIGCVMCPMSGSESMCADAVRWPKFAAYYMRICEDIWMKRRANNIDFTTYNFSCPEEYFYWWTGAEAVYPKPQEEDGEQRFFLFD